jgi:hypothetical protein
LTAASAADNTDATEPTSSFSPHRAALDAPQTLQRPLVVLAGKQQGHIDRVPAKIALMRQQPSWCRGS